MKILNLLSLLLLSSSALSKEILCPSQGITSSAGDKPALVMKSHGFHVLVCGSPDNDKGKNVYSGFDVYAEKDGQTSNLLSKGELDSFSVKKSGNSIAITELAYFRKRYIPVIQVKLRCDAKACQFSNEKCVFKKPKAFDTDVLEKIAQYTTGPKKEEYPDEALITELEATALTGNRKAIEIFEVSPGLKLDGATAEEYRRTKSLLSRLKNAGCAL